MKAIGKWADNLVALHESNKGNVNFWVKRDATGGERWEGKGREIMIWCRILWRCVPIVISVWRSIDDTSWYFTRLRSIPNTAQKRSKEEEEKKQEQNNYIFVVDRSGSMLFTIGLVKNALKVFLQGLDEESYFNICSFGNKELK
jgi:hypothetical protein